MKKLTMICMSALLMLAVSCKKDKKDEIENAGSGFRATVESHEGTGKTHLDGLAVKWDSGDAILVKSSTCTTPKRFTTTGTDASASFDAAENLPEGFYTPDYTGYYPGFETNPAGVYFSGNQLTLPATQNYVENTFASGANPMAATSSDNVLPFKNVCGVLKLQLYSATACQVQSISITSNTGEMLYGTGAVGFDAADDNDNPTLGTLNDGGSTLTLDMGEGGKAMSTSGSAPTAYYFVVPVGTLGTSFTVKVTDTEGGIWTKTANSSANRIARSQITKMPELPVTVTKAHEYVDLGLSVKWATCNLGAEHEYDYGDYYAWGEIEPYYAEGHSQDNPCSTWRSMTTGAGNKVITNGYAWETYSQGGSSSFAEWTTKPYDDDKILTSDYDAATQEWGSDWRMPTGGADGEWQELASNTYMKWEYDYAGTGVAGFIVYKVKNESDKGLMTVDDNMEPEDPNWVTYDQDWNATGEPVGYLPSDVHLFLPAAGYRTGTSLYAAGSLGGYWSSSLRTDNPGDAYDMDFTSGGVSPQDYNSRYYGLTVRPVR